MAIRLLSFRWSFLIVAVLLGVLVGGVLVSPLLSDYGPHPRPSTSIADSRKKGRYYKAVIITPQSIRMKECDIAFDEAWIEKAALRKPLFFGFSYDKPVGYYFLCFTIKKGQQCFVGEDRPFFVFDNRDSSFASINGSEMFWTKLSDVKTGENTIFLLSSWHADRRIFVKAKVE